MQRLICLQLLNALLAVGANDYFGCYVGRNRVERVGADQVPNGRPMPHECWTQCHRCTGTWLTGAIVMPWEKALWRMDNDAKYIGNPCWCSTGKQCTEDSHCAQYKDEYCVGPCYDDNFIRVRNSFLLLFDFTLGVFIYPFIACVFMIRFCCCGVFDRVGGVARLAAQHDKRLDELKTQNDELQQKIDGIGLDRLERLESQLNDLEEEIDVSEVLEERGESQLRRRRSASPPRRRG